MRYDVLLFPLLRMSHESIEREPVIETADKGSDKAVVQIGSAQVVDATGAFGRAHQKVVGLSEGQNGDISGTLKGNRLTKLLAEEVAAGKTEIVLDLSRAEDLKPEDVKAQMHRRDELKHHGVNLTLTGLTAAEELELKTGGAITNGLTTYTKTRGDAAFKTASTETLAA